MYYRDLYFNSVVAAGFILEAAIMVRILRTTLRRDLRVFLFYMVFSLTRTMLLTPIRTYYGFGSAAYFIAYWTTMAADTVLVFFVIQEVYANVLHRYDGLRKLSGAMFRWTFVILILLALITAYTAPANDTVRLTAMITVFDRGAMMVEAGLLVLLFVVAKALSLSWRQCIFGIAFGLCLFSILDLAALTARANLGDAFGFYYSLFKPAAYVATEFIWVVYLFRPERTRDREFIPFGSDTLDHWNAAVLQYLNR